MEQASYRVINILLDPTRQEHCTASHGVLSPHTCFVNTLATVTVFPLIACVCVCKRLDKRIP